MTPRHWTVITSDDGDHFIDCSCKWSGYATTWDEALEQAQQHKETNQ